MKTKNNTVIPIIYIAIGLIIVAAFILGIHFTKTYSQKNDDIPSGEAIIYGPNDNIIINFDNGNKLGKYLNFNENEKSVKLSFVNKTSEDWKPRLDFYGVKTIDGTETKYGSLTSSYSLVNKSNDFVKPGSDTEHSFVLYDKLIITIDGTAADDCVISPDGKEHIVEIDYSYFDDNSIEDQGSFTVDMESFILASK